jgi:hypothetical protein
MANRKRVRNDVELTESTKHGVPSWRNPEAYPTAAAWKKMSKDKQKWEFLRRTQEYRKDWDRSQSKTSSSPEVISKFHAVRTFDGKALAAKYRMSHPVSPKSGYINLPKGFHFIRPTSSGGHIVYPRRPVPFQEVNPAKDTWDAKFAAAAEKTIPDMTPHDWYEMRVWVEFDLGHGIDEQIIQAKANMIAAAQKVEAFMEALRSPDGQYGTDAYVPQKVRAKNKRGANKKAKASEEELPIIALLRILDAKNCGRTNAQIAPIMGIADNSTVSKRYQAASRLWKTL